MHSSLYVYWHLNSSASVFILTRQDDIHVSTCRSRVGIMHCVQSRNAVCVDIFMAILWLMCIQMIQIICVFEPEDVTDFIIILLW